MFIYEVCKLCSRLLLPLNLELEFGTHSGTFNKRWPLPIDTDKLKFTKFPNDMVTNAEIDRPSTYHSTSDMPVTASTMRE